MINTNETYTNRQHLPTVVWLARATYMICAGLLAACIVLQVFFAGLGVLVNPTYWELHRVFGNNLPWLTIVMLILGVVGRLPWRTVVLTALVILLFALQFVFLWTMPAIGLPTLRALHAVNALAMFWLTVHLAHHAWQLRQAPERAPRHDRTATSTTSHG